jgi:hypothetical protein
MQSGPAEAEAARLGVIILGASAFPHFPAARRLDNQSFARSARAFRALVEAPGAMLLGAPAVLDLFDAEDDPGQLVRRMRAFLKEAGAFTDVVIYYCGHGDFLADTHKSYILTLRSTEPDNEAFTALPLRQMRLSLDSQLATKRVFLILDCCFAGRAATEWQADGIGHVIEDQVFQSFPKRGTALIAASAKGMPAVAPEGEPLTMFTGVLADIVGEGLKGSKQQLSFREVFEAVKARIVDRYGARAAAPVIHAPHQPDGDISFDPFFINKGYLPPPEPAASLAERDHFDLAVAELDRPLVKTRVAGVEALAELHTNARSAAFRAEIVDRLRRVHAEDDSNSVKSRAREVLSVMGSARAEETVGETALPPENNPAPPEPSKPEPDTTKPPPLPWWRHLIEGTGALAIGLAALAVGGAIFYFIFMFGGMVIDKAGDGISYLGTAVVELFNGKPADDAQGDNIIVPPLGRDGGLTNPMGSLSGQPRFGGGSLADQIIKGAIPDSTSGSTQETPPTDDSPFKPGQ